MSDINTAQSFIQDRLSGNGELLIIKQGEDWRFPLISQAQDILLINPLHGQSFSPTITVHSLTDRQYYNRLECGNMIVGYVGHQVFTHFVKCLSRYEPDTKNKGGTLGAYRDIPNEQNIDLAVKRMRAKILKISSNYHENSAVSTGDNYDVTT